MNASKYKTAHLWKKVVQNTQTTDKKPHPPASTMGTSSPAASPTASPKPKFNIHAVATSILEKRKMDRERELKVKQDEIDDYKSKHEKEKEEKMQLQARLDELMSSQNDAGLKLVKANEVLDKVRVENKKKTEQIEKMQGKISFMEDRIRNLENKASEVEKAELTLESTRKTLEATIAMCRAKDGEIQRTTASKETTDKNLEVANAKIKELEDKITDLKFQVRHELMKNETIEKGLETIPSLKDDIREKDDEIKMLSKEVEEKSALLLAARKAIREYKDKLREVNKTIHTNIDIQNELNLSQCEVTTLKNLMAGKDMLVLHKSRALELAKETIDSLQRSPEIGHQVQKIEQILKNLSRLSDNVNETKLLNGTGDYKRSSDSKLSPSKTTQSKGRSSPITRDYNKEININVPPYSMENGHDDNNKHSKSNIYFERVSSRPKTAVGHRGKESVCQNGSSSGNMKRPGTCISSCSDRSMRSSFTDGRSQARYHTRSGDSQETSRNHSTPFAVGYSKGDYSDTETDSSSQELGDAAFKMSHECRMEISRMSVTEKDNLLSKVINVGDRVSISLPQKLPKYGRKKPKPIIYNGIVKYKGNMDKEDFDTKKYVGVKLDLPIGDSDGMYKGKRYMFTPPEHGKFFKMRDITAMLDIQTGHYEPIMRMMLLHLGRETHESQEQQHHTH